MEMHQGSRFTSLLPPLGAGASATVLFAVRVSSPAVVFLATLSLLFVKPLSPLPSPITPVVVQSRVPRRTLILVLLSLSALSFLVDGLAYVADAVFNKAWTLGTGIPLASLLGLVAYAGLAAVGAWRDIHNVQVWSFRRVSLAIALALTLDIVQVVLLALSVTTRGAAHLCDNTKLSKCIPDTFHLFAPFVRVLILTPLLFALYSPRIVYTHVETQPEVQVNSNENVPLQEDGPTGESSKYGTFTTLDQCESGPPPTCPVAKQHPAKHRTAFATLRLLTTYLYSLHSGRLNFLTAFAILLHIITRLLKPLVPLSLAAAVNAFISHPPATSYPIPMPFGTSPYPYIFTFVVLYFLTSPNGIPALVLALGSRIGGHADSILESAYTAHVLGLSLGDTTGVKDKVYFYPTGAVSKAVEALSIVEAVVLDAFIGIVIFGLLFDWKVALGVFIVLDIYVYASCVLSLPTVPCSVSHVSPAFALLTLVQGLIVSGGLLLGSLYIAQGVVDGIWSVGAWVFWVWYWGALVLPFSSAPCLSRTLEDVRAALDVLAQPAGIPHSGNGSLDGDGVDIRFENVSFTYPYSAEHTQPFNPLLSSVSFTVPASATVALVGAPGSGKSTILKLLYRLYSLDPNNGTIYLNGKKIQDISLLNIRDRVAVVAKTSEDERRSAVSRALAKDARIILVEGDLDADVLTLVNSSRTVLWEVSNTHLANVQEGVDQIIVLRDGRVAEQGTFKELLEANGVFATMWAEHIQETSAPAGSAPSAAGYDVEVVDAEAVSGSGVMAESPRATSASLHPAESVRAPSLHAPTASIRAESIAPAVPAKDSSGPITFPTSESEVEPAPSAAPVVFPTSDETTTQVPAPVTFPTSDDTRSISSQPRPAIPGHVQGASVTFDTTTTPPRASTPDPFGTPNSEPADGKRKRISSQNFQRVARRISLSMPRKGSGIPGIPGIANIANVLKRDSSLKGESKDRSGESSVKDTDVGSGTGSGGNSARNSGEITRQSDKDKEREEKKKRRKSFMQIGSSGST
ncbi:hypothetical protein V8B97DRAFT_1930805 [Scleroderma yunnanense]